jgi:2-hydroxychromene-2-carboxylate isomerase
MQGVRREAARFAAQRLAGGTGLPGALMSIKTLLMPAISQRMLSRERLLQRRATAERQRRARREPHRLHYFHQVDDPYSALAAAALPRLLQRYDVELVAHVVGPPADSAAPERDKLVAYSRKDAQRLAGHCGLEFVDPGVQPSDVAIDAVSRLLVGAIDTRRFAEHAAALSAKLWQDAARPDAGAWTHAAIEAASAAAQRLHIDAAQQLRQRLGHYLGATFFYGGEWYWGIDRLYHLEQRLQDLGAQRPGVTGAMFPTDDDLPPVPPLAKAPTIDFYFSLRSPYSAIVAPRIFELARRCGAPLRLRFMLPMVMRGLPLPREKRRYIALDAAREAFVRGIPFGRVNDPVGRPAQRGLALVPFAEQAGQGESFVLSFMRGVWAEGIDAGSDAGLRRIVERAGLTWGAAREALKDEAWRQTAEANRAEMFAMGLWGVPSFRVRDTAVWGQDRLWAVRQALCESGSSLPR